MCTLTTSSAPWNPPPTTPHAQQHDRRLARPTDSLIAASLTWVSGRLVRAASRSTACFRSSGGYIVVSVVMFNMVPLMALRE